MLWFLMEVLLCMIAFWSIGTILRWITRDLWYQTRRLTRLKESYERCGNLSKVQEIADQVQGLNRRMFVRLTAFTVVFVAALRFTNQFHGSPMAFVFLSVPFVILCAQEVTHVIARRRRVHRQNA